MLPLSSPKTYVPKETSRGQLHISNTGSKDSFTHYAEAQSVNLSNNSAVYQVETARKAPQVNGNDMVIQQRESTRQHFSSQVLKMFICPILVDKQTGRKVDRWEAWSNTPTIFSFCRNNSVFPSGATTLIPNKKRTNGNFLNLIHSGESSNIVPTLALQIG